MKNITGIILLHFSIATLARDSTISCNVKEEFDKKIYDVKVEFVISDLGQPNAQLKTHPQVNNEDGYSPILVKIKGKTEQSSNMENLNAQGGDLRVGNDRIRLFGDGDGYTFVDLVLFKNSGYKKGYVSVSGSGDKFYQKLNCMVK